MKFRVFFSIFIWIGCAPLHGNEFSIEIPNKFVTLDELKESDDQNLKARFKAFESIFKNDSAKLLELALDIENMSTVAVYIEHSKLTPKEMLEAIYKRFMRGQKHLGQEDHVSQKMIENFQNKKGVHRMDVILKNNGGYTLSYIAHSVDDESLLITLLGFSGEEYHPELENILATIKYD